VVNILLGNAGVQPTRTDRLGRTALFLASRMGHHNVVRVLLADGRTPPEAKDWRGSTSLFAAVRNGHAEVAELLLPAAGTAIEDQDGFGRTLIWWARRTGNSRVLQLLVQQAERTSSPIHGNAAPPETISAPFIYQSAWCDACTLSIPESCGYSC
ncbi:ankyrin repeat-containing domain protein, partial [Microdochium trichocladiopsis]